MVERKPVQRAWLSISLAALLIATARLAPAQEVPEALKACIARYEKLDQQIKWIRLDTTSITSPEVTPEEYYELTHNVEPTSATSSLVYASDGRTYCRTKSTSKSVTSVMNHMSREGIPWKEDFKGFPRYADITPWIADAPADVRDETSVYDGKQLVNRKADALSLDGKPLDTFQIVNIDRLRSSYFDGIHSVPLHFFLITFPIPGMPNDDKLRRSIRLGDLLKEQKLKLLSESEEVNGYKCIKVEFDDKVVWLAPELNFAVVRRCGVLQGQIVWQFEGEDFKNWGDDFWFPTRFTSTCLRNPNAEDTSPKYLGKPIYTTRYSVKLLRINDPADEKLFSHGPEASDLVMDEVAAKDLGVQKEGRNIPIVSYQAPDDPAELEKTREAAVDRFASSVATYQAARVRTNAIVASIFAALALVILIVVIVYRTRRRHRAETTFEYKP